MDPYLIHDIKTERRDVSRGLPGYLMIVPVLFYIVLVFGLAGMLWFEVGKRKAIVEAGNWSYEQSRFQVLAVEVSKEREKIEALNEVSQVVVEWVEGAHNLQPLCVAISRGAGDKSSVAELLLARNTEIPEQIHFTLKMDKVSSQVLDETLQGVRDLDFRAYSAQQQKNQDSLDYNATLVWQSSAQP